MDVAVPAPDKVFCAAVREERVEKARRKRTMPVLESQTSLQQILNRGMLRPQHQKHTLKPSGLGAVGPKKALKPREPPMKIPRLEGLGAIPPRPRHF